MGNQADTNTDSNAIDLRKGYTTFMKTAFPTKADAEKQRDMWCSQEYLDLCEKFGIKVTKMIRIYCAAEPITKMDVALIDNAQLAGVILDTDQATQVMRDNVKLGLAPAVTSAETVEVA